MNYYPFHLGDYSAHTGHLEPLEDLAYRRMLDAYYLREAPLPAEPAEVARLIRMRQNMAEVEVVLREFFESAADGWRHARCDEEIERMQDKQAKARASAAASVNARRAKAQPPLNDGTSNAERTFNDRSTDVELPTPTPTPINNPPTPRKREGVRFEEFWTAWPKSERKQDKAKCLDHWKRNNLDELAGPILQDIQTKRQTQKWAEGFIEAPLVYLRGKRWMDGVTPAPATGTVEPLDWRSTQSGIRAKGVEVGIGDWDEAAFSAGQGEHFPAYRQRVEAKVREVEGRAIDPAGQRRIADLIGNVMKARA